jgi:hypothetical protein
MIEAHRVEGHSRMAKRKQKEAGARCGKEENKMEKQETI